MNPNEARTTEEAEEAKRWVEGLERSKGWVWVDTDSVAYSIGDSVIFMNGKFTKAELRALADYMEQHSKEGR